MGTFFLGLRILTWAFRCLVWCLGTVWLGAKAIWRGLRIMPRLNRLSAQTLACPRGHREPAFGVFTCEGCGGSLEGWVFRACPICGQSAAWFPCSQCGLPVKHPVPELLE